MNEKCCVVRWTKAVVIYSGFVNVWYECAYLKCIWLRINRCVLLSLLHMFLLLHVEKKSYDNHNTKQVCIGLSM